ncbi:RagB/SusD family nutrient uptake outer membrane protein [Flavobacterium sp. LS1R49]|uniref:RagB/SusD family nutrient uptake outer membrane protein n=1 Tax=Flavobacterium shii TaxID=2987687 RepID=A0A9X2ZCZ9_9FLAO|nr:RagB/SusD family nutrient uptake outer membrane protein [Flavobacterium shii]MCV9928295.1 RagB/SusD family nutrient uptake outer membrane protein [Flavobacterium shii]
MKRFFKTYKWSGLSLIFLFMGISCQEDFTNRPAEDGISLDSYYSTNEQVASATNGMYSRTWFQMYNKFWWALEVGAGNMYSGSPDVAGLRTFSLNGSDAELVNGWSSLWANVQQSNMIINFLASRVGPGVDQAVLSNTIGEAYFLRATAYFDLVRLWGPVPIIENPLDYASNPYINTNTVDDVYKLIIMDYLKAIDLLADKNRGANYANNGHVSKGSAKAFLAKVYLYRKDYINARAMAESVINSGEFKLLGGDELPSKSFGDLFTYSNNNNEESIFAIQWKGDGNYGSANNCNTQFGFADGGLSTSNASYAGVFGPSQDIFNLYTAGDKREHETIMVGGDTYPNIKTTEGIGLTVPTNKDLAQGSGGAIKKYCIGVVNGTVTGPTDSWAMMDNNSYVMRYAELLLIHAEAILAGGGSTSDAAALRSINAVRKRAGLTTVSSFTFDDLFLERRKELCFEGDYWFDLGRIDKTKAIDIMFAQNRGDRNAAQHFKPIYSEDHAANDFYMDYPDNEVAKNPKLLDPPVPYTFK